jgi:hypothetical protein
MSNTHCAYCGIHRDNIVLVKSCWGAERHSFTIDRTTADKTFKDTYMRKGTLYDSKTHEEITRKEQLYICPA